MEFKTQVVIATGFMAVVPLCAFLGVRKYLTDYVYKNEEYYSSPRHKSNLIDTYSMVAAVVGVWLVIVGVIIVKNMDDCIDTFCRGKGHQIYSEEDVPNKWLEEDTNENAEMVKTEDKPQKRNNKKSNKNKKNKNKHQKLD